MGEILGGILLVVYIIAAWWAINKIWYSKHTYIVSNTMQFYMTKFIFALMLGVIAIPIAIIMTIIGRNS